MAGTSLQERIAFEEARVREFEDGLDTLRGVVFHHVNGRIVRKSTEEQIETLCFLVTDIARVVAKLHRHLGILDKEIASHPGYGALYEQHKAELSKLLAQRDAKETKRKETYARAKARREQVKKGEPNA